MFTETTSNGPAAVFAALGDPIRLGLVTRLCDDGPCSIARLTEGTALTRQAITKHLRLMEGVGLVHHAKKGRESIWQLDSARIREALVYLDQISKQ
jgi:DNA-binding transcriptional ArsR family regulator